MYTNSETTSDTAAATPAASSASHELAVTLPADLHARPAGQLARAAARFTSRIRIEQTGRSVDPTGVLAVMSMGATAGTTVTVRAEGEDAIEAAEALAHILATAE